MIAIGRIPILRRVQNRGGKVELVCIANYESYPVSNSFNNEESFLIWFKKRWTNAHASPA
ncbi:MAG: hypothetical protein R3D62_18830 [Xanthobacteraceae bacterium]